MVFAPIPNFDMHAICVVSHPAHVIEAHPLFCHMCHFVHQSIILRCVPPLMWDR